MGIPTATSYSRELGQSRQVDIRRASALKDLSEGYSSSDRVEAVKCIDRRLREGDIPGEAAIVQNKVLPIKKGRNPEAGSEVEAVSPRSSSPRTLQLISQKILGSGRDLKIYLKGSGSSSDSKKLERNTFVAKNLLKKDSEFHKQLDILMERRSVSLKSFSTEFVMGQIWDAVKHGYDGGNGFIKGISEKYGARNNLSKNSATELTHTSKANMANDIQTDVGSLRFREYVVNYIQLFSDVLDSMQIKDKDKKTLKWKCDFQKILCELMEIEDLQSLLERIQAAVEAMDPVEQKLMYSVFGGASNYKMLANLDAGKMSHWINDIHEKSKKLAESTKNLEQMNDYEIPHRKVLLPNGREAWLIIHDSIRRSCFVDGISYVEKFEINDRLIEIPTDSLSNEREFYQFIIREIVNGGWQKGRFKGKTESYIEEFVKSETENLLADPKHIRASSLHPVLRVFTNNDALEDWELFQRAWPRINQFLSGDSNRQGTKKLNSSSKQASKRHLLQQSSFPAGFGDSVQTEGQKEYLNCKKEGKEPVSIIINDDGRSFKAQRVSQIKICPLLDGLETSRVGDSYGSVEWIATVDAKVSIDEEGNVITEGSLSGSIRQVTFVDSTSLEKRLDIIERLTEDKINVGKNKALAELRERSGEVSVRSRRNSTIEPSEAEEPDLPDAHKPKIGVASRIKKGLKRKTSHDKGKDKP